MHCFNKWITCWCLNVIWVSTQNHGLGVMNFLRHQPNISLGYYIQGWKLCFWNRIIRLVWCSIEKGCTSFKGAGKVKVDQKSKEKQRPFEILDVFDVFNCDLHTALLKWRFSVSQCFRKWSMIRQKCSDILVLHHKK